MEKKNVCWPAASVATAIIVFSDIYSTKWRDIRYFFWTRGGQRAEGGGVGLWKENKHLKPCDNSYNCTLQIQRADSGKIPSSSALKKKKKKAERCTHHKNPPLTPPPPVRFVTLIDEWQPRNIKEWKGGRGTRRQRKQSRHQRLQ